MAFEESQVKPMVKAYLQVQLSGACSRAGFKCRSRSRFHVEVELQEVQEVQEV